MSIFFFFFFKERQWLFMVGEKIFLTIEVDFFFNNFFVEVFFCFRTKKI